MTSVSEAITSPRSRATYTDSRFMLARTPRVVARDDQCPMPNRFVRSAATAFRNAASAAASSATARVSPAGIGVAAQFDVLCWRRSKTRFSGAGPNDAHGTTRVWFTPGFE